jgi:ABC-type proline/glycine betaine transport system substrate-binding protein
LYNYSRRGFEADQPEAATFFKNFNLEGQLADLMTIIKDKGEEAGAKEWYEAIKTLNRSFDCYKAVNYRICYTRKAFIE